MDDLSQLLLASLVGGGVVGLIAWGGLLWHLRKIFFTREEADGLGSRLNDMERDGSTLARRDHEHLMRLESEIRRDLIGPIQEITRAIQELREWRVGEEANARWSSKLLQEIRDHVFNDDRHP